MSHYSILAISFITSLVLCHTVWKRPKEWHTTFNPKTKMYFGWTKSEAEDKEAKFVTCLIGTVLIMSIPLSLS